MFPVRTTANACQIVLPIGYTIGSAKSCIIRLNIFFFFSLISPLPAHDVLIRFFPAELPSGEGPPPAANARDGPAEGGGLPAGCETQTRRRLVLQAAKADAGEAGPHQVCVRACECVTEREWEWSSA